MRTTTLGTALGMALSAATMLGFTDVHAGDAAAGKAKSATCAACHGQNGIAIAPEYPNLAGQNEKYLAIAIKAYKSGDRKNPLMQPMVAPLTDVDVENLAAYYASLACK
ncbi:MAG: cytochrome c [Gammaproteobacteria bacterium]|nr:cytochrome c [Gammaproteobacteria bacterium]